MKRTAKDVENDWSDSAEALMLYHNFYVALGLRAFNSQSLFQVRYLVSLIMGSCAGVKSTQTYEPSPLTQAQPGSFQHIETGHTSPQIPQNIDQSDIKVQVQSSSKKKLNEQYQSSVSSQKASSYNSSNKNQMVHRSPENASEERIDVLTLSSRNQQSSRKDETMENQFQRVIRSKSVIHTLDTSSSAQAQNLGNIAATENVRRNPLGSTLL